MKLGNKQHIFECDVWSECNIDSIVNWDSNIVRESNSRRVNRKEKIKGLNAGTDMPRYTKVYYPELSKGQVLLHRHIETCTCRIGGKGIGCIFRGMSNTGQMSS